MTKHLLLIHIMTLSLLLGDGTVQISLTNGQEVQGEFIGTYMDHVHILTGEKLYYYACDDIRSILSPEETFDYDCSENTVTADILFPPVLDPMTGEWAQKLPDVFNPDIAQPIATTEADAVDTDPPTVDLGVVEPQFEEEVSTFEEKDDTKKDFIMINGVRYVRASSDGETDQDSTPIATREEVIFQATQMAQQMEKKSHHQVLGAGACLFSSIGIPVSILYVESAKSEMNPSNPFYMDLDPSLKVVYEQFYKKEEKRLRRKTVYGTEGGCLLLLIGGITLYEEIWSLQYD